MCLSIGTNGKFIIFRCPNTIKVDSSLITMCLNTGTLKNITFSFQTNGKLLALGVPILKHFWVKTVPSSVHKQKLMNGHLGHPHIRWTMDITVSQQLTLSMLS